MSSIPAFTRTRIAPTPSGYLHLGNVLSFAITAALAQQSGASILLRIDDLDRERVADRYVQDIFDTLNFLQLPWHEGPRNVAEYKSDYSQLHRMHLYSKALQQLRQGDALFACTCTRRQLLSESDGIYAGTCCDRQISFDAGDACWRLRTDNARPQRINTFGGIASDSLSAEMAHFVVRKKDGYPAYQLASVIDDVHFGVDLVVRGKDLWASTVAQHYVAGQLHSDRFSSITFHHHPLLIGPSGGKLSKSAGDTSIQQLRKEGRRPADIFNLIANMLGLQQPADTWQELGRQVIGID